MASLTKSVNKQTVNYQDTFIYTINASFSGLGHNPITDAYITDVIPSYLDYILPPVGGIIKSITQTPYPDPITGPDTLLKFDFGPITNTGVAYLFELRCKFKLKTPNGTSFINTADLNIVTTPSPIIINAIAPKVTLSATPILTLTKTKLLPTIEPAVGSTIVYTLTLRNIGDPGAEINNVYIEDILPTGVTIDPTFTPIGKDISPSPYQDNSWNKTADSGTSEPIIFDFSASGPYYGTIYQITIKAIVGPTLSTGDEITNTAKWSVNNIFRPDVTLTNTLIDPTQQSNISKYGPNTAYPGYKISYELYPQSTANIDSTNVEMVDNIPPEVTIDEIYTGTYGISNINYQLGGTLTISVSTDNGVTYTDLPGPYVPSVGTWVTITNTPDKVTNIKWTFSEWVSGVSYIISPKLNGIIDPLATPGITIINIASITDGTSIAQKQTVLNRVPVLNLSKSRVGINSPVIPTQVYKYSLSFNTNASQISNAYIEDLLPPEVTFNNNVIATYSNYFDGSTAITVLTTTSIDPGTGRTLVRFTITSPTAIEQRSNVRITFDVKVNVGATGTIQNNASINAMYSTGAVTSNTISTEILFNVGLASTKQVKGALDPDFLDYPGIGTTYNAGPLEYRLIVGNVGNVNLETFEVVDIFPHIGDTGVILVNEQRDSDFPVYISGPFSVDVTSTNPNLPVPTAIIEYSQSYDPVRFGENNTIIGTVNDWTTVMPYPTNTVKSIKIRIAQTNLKPGQTVTVTIKAVVPLGVSTGMIAYNSYAIRGTYFNTNGVLSQLLPTEPEKVGIQVDLPTYEGEIGNFAFHDVDGDGFYDPAIDFGLNGVTVELYDDATGTLLGSTITNNNQVGEPGYYLFSNLETNKTYYLKFIAPIGYDYTIQQAGFDNGSKPNEFGITNPITITDAEPSYLYAIAGFLDEICVTDSLEECLYLLIGTQERIDFIDTTQSFAYVFVIDSNFDKNTIVYKDYSGTIVAGFNLYINLGLYFHIHYNSDTFADFLVPYETVIFVPDYISDNPFAIETHTQNLKFYISGSRTAFYITLELETCMNF